MLQQQDVCASLLSLDLTNNGIGDTGARALADALEQRPLDSLVVRRSLDLLI